MKGDHPKEGLQITTARLVAAAPPPAVERDLLERIIAVRRLQVVSAS